MTNIIGIAYDPSAEAVRVGFGHRWGDLYEHLEPFNRLVVGGRVPSVGLALTIGGKTRSMAHVGTFLTMSLDSGGLSHLSNQYGFSADNAVSFEIVLANATMVVANSSSFPDLFWALKGGSNNFGMWFSKILIPIP